MRCGGAYVRQASFDSARPTPCDKVPVTVALGLRCYQRWIERQAAPRPAGVRRPLSGG